MNLEMQKICGGSILAGSLSGRQALGSLLERVREEPAEPERVLLNFDGVKVATASFLRESVLEFRDVVRRRRSNFYPIVANANESVIEEMSILLAQSKDALMSCSTDDTGAPIRPRLIGDLEPKQRITYDLVRKLGETDAGALLHFRSGGEDVGQTAWNNRLSALTRLGLTIELRNGRIKRYRPLLAES